MSTTTNEWCDDECALLIEFWEGNFEDYATKVKKVFYDNAAKHVGTKSSTKIKNKIEHMERKYKSLKAKMGASGFGVEESDPPTVRERILREFKWYYEIDNFLGARHNIQPPCLLDSGDIEISSSQDSIKTSLSEDSVVKLEETGQKRKRSSTPDLAEVLYKLGKDSIEVEKLKMEIMTKKLQLQSQQHIEQMQLQQESLQLQVQAIKNQHELGMKKLELLIMKNNNE